MICVNVSVHGISVVFVRSRASVVFVLTNLSDRHHGTSRERKTVLANGANQNRTGARR